MALLVLVRHGESQWNRENRFTGWVDVPLTDTGRQEAARAGEQLRGMHFDIAYTSTLQRANETLDIILRAIGLTTIPVVRDEALNERHYGDLQGLDKAETAAKFGAEQVHIWRRSFDVAPPNGESLKDTAARTLPYFDRVIVPEIRAGQHVLVAAHGNSLRSIVMHLDQLTKEQVMELNIPTGVPIVYDLDAEMHIRSKRILGR
ncbi:MAG: 2,3-bisphosphoglycerate-dependent phosphoglycerate mutase [Candidatus Binatia bacterium]